VFFKKQKSFVHMNGLS